MSIRDSKKPRIGVFDSGLGGLSVLKVLAKNFPNEEFLYLGDTARLPYGSKSPETIAQYTEQNLKWLADRNCKALIIACNTASSHFQKNEYNNIPVYNVIGPGSEMALSVSQSKVIGVLGTRATIQSESYNKKIKELDPNATIYSVACPMFVPLVEEGWNEDPITNLIVYRYIQNLRNQNSDELMDTVILGCTHYPFLRNSIQKSIGSHIKLIESGDVLSIKLAQDAEAGRWQRASATDTSENEATGSLDYAKIILTSTDRSLFFEKLALDLLSPLVPTQFELVNI